MNQRELEIATDGEIILYLMQNKDTAIRLNSPNIPPVDNDESWDYWQFTWTNINYQDESGEWHQTEGFLVEERSGYAVWSGRSDEEYDDWNIWHYTHLDAEQAIIKLRQAMEDGYKPSFPKYDIPV